MKQNWCWLPFLFLAACGQDAPSDAENTNASATPPAEEQTAAPANSAQLRAVSAEILLGQFESDVTDLAAWEAQPFGFQSLVLAANGEAGIVSVRADGGNAQAIVTEPTTVRFAAAETPEGEGLLITLAAEGTIQARATDDLAAAPRDLLSLPSARDLCTDGSLVLAVGGMGGEVIMGQTDLPIASIPNGALNCEVLGDDIYVQTAEGWDRLTSAGLEPTPLPRTASTLVQAGSQVFAMGPSGANGELSINDQSIPLETNLGEPLRPLMVAAAYGNLGGVLRDGALIILDEQRNLYLVGWSGIANQLGLPGQLPSVRAPMGSAEVEFEGPNDEITLDAPEFEETPAPLPPGRDQ